MESNQSAHLSNNKQKINDKTKPMDMTHKIPKYTLVAGLALLSMVNKSLAQEAIKVPAKIKEVTVYKQGATLSHKASINIPKGNHEIVIYNIANRLDAQSIQLQTPAPLNVMSMTFTQQYTDKKNKEIALPNSEIQQARRKLQQIANKRIAEERTLQLLENNQNFSGSQNGITALELSKLTAFYKKQQSSIRDSIELYKEQEVVQNQLVAQLEKETGTAAKIGATEGGYLVLQVQATAPVISDITIDYFSQQAKWTPTYDIKVTKVSQPVNISYKANLSQTTGIDWQNVNLKLSTGNPAQNNTAPTLEPWFLSTQNTSNYARNSDDAMTESISPAIRSRIRTASATSYKAEALDLRGASSQSANTNPLIILDGSPYSGQLNEIDPSTIYEVKTLDNAESKSLYGSRGANGVIIVNTKNTGYTDHIQLTEKALDAEFDISIPYDVTSNGKPHAVTLKEMKHNATYNYYAVPKLDKDAFLMASLTNFEALQLLPGEASVYFENTYTGKTWINPLLPQDTIALSLGRDKKIAINRQLISDKSSTKVLSNKKVMTYTYDIKIRNTKAEPIQLKLEEAYPISRSSNVEVSLLETSKASDNAEKGILTWQLKLQPNETKTLRISYSIKHPSNEWLNQ